jgi:hypothetical protein
MKSLLTLALLAAGLQFANAQTTPTTTRPTPQATRPAPTVEAQKQQPTATTIAPKPAEQATVDPKTLKWSEETYDFGTIPQGTPVTHDFKVTNNGTTPIVISKVDKSCGCTTPKWTTEPIMPGKEGTVSATFNAAAVGGFSKTVTVHSNAGTKVLYIKGTVVAKDGTTTPATGHEGHQH